MSGNKVKRIPCEDIQLVHNYIEQCIQRHMSLNEVKNTLFVKAKIEPGFTELVWKKLEGDNPDFFKVYHLRLLLKDQIVKFNQLLERQVELMRQQLPGPTTMNISNGSHIPLNGEMPVSCNSIGQEGLAVVSHSQLVNNNNLLGANDAYEIPGQLPRSFSLSDFTAVFSLDVLERDSGSPLFATGSDNILNPQYSVEQQDTERSKHNI